jgi:hypothetical protein
MFTKFLSCWLGCGFLAAFTLLLWSPLVADSGSNLAGESTFPRAPIALVPFKLGDNVNTVKAAMDFESDPQPVEGETLTKQEVSSLNAPWRGIRVFFNKDGRVDLVRLQDPFPGVIHGVKIGDSLKSALATLGPPTKTSWVLFADMYPYWYKLYDGTGIALLIDHRKQVRFIFLIANYDFATGTAVPASSQ